MDWTFPKALSYGAALGLLLALLSLNVAGEIWPQQNLLACFSNPAGLSLRTTAHF